MFKPEILKFVCSFTLAVMLMALFSASPVHADTTVINPGFEADNTRTTPPQGWTVTGATEASYTEWDGHSGNWRLSNWSPNAYVVETSQTLTGLANGWYTLRAWVKSSGGQNAA